jgi:hypothetical protein
MNVHRLLAGISVVFTLTLSTIWAQTTSTSIIGTVTDPSGAAIQGAKVTALQVRTGIQREDVTSGTGDFTFPLLDVGEYTVTVEVAGFKTATRAGINLQINEKVRADFTLQVGQVTERVEVAASGVTLKTDEVSLGNVVEQRRLVELPVNGRNVGNLAVLQPGVQFAPRGGLDGQTGSGGGIPIPGQTIALIANGQRETNQHATLDGVVATEARINTVPFSPTPEAMEEVKVLTGSYSAEYGFNSGAQLIMIMRSGTNEFHGSAFEFLRNDALDAENYFQNYFLTPGQTRLKKQGIRQNQFGGTFAGPVWIPKLYNGRDKTFFMFGAERRLRRLPGAASSALVPSDAMRAGDFSALLNRRSATGATLPAVTIVDPLTNPDAPTPFAGNIIPQSRISPTALALNSYWEKPQTILPDPLTGFNYTGAGRQTIDDDQLYVKVDHNFSSKDKIMGRYATNIPNWNQIPGASPQFTYLVTGRNNNVATQWLHIFSPTIINEARYGYNQSRSDSFNPRANTDFDLASIGLGNFRVVTDNNRPLTPRETGVPTMSVSGFQTLAELDGGNGFDDNRLHQVNDNVTISAGAHNFKTGMDYRRVSLYRGAANVPRGSFSFNSDVANNSYAAFLLGLPTATATPEGLPLTDVRQNRWAAYFQDDWKISRRLTMNIGVRYEYNTDATDVQGLWRSLEFTNGLNSDPVFVPAAIRTVYKFYDPQKTMFMPRLGFAFRLSDSTVIRTGYGIYYNLHQLNNYTILNLNPPLSGSSNFNNNIRNGALIAGNPVYTFSNPFGPVSPTSAVNANALNTDNFQPYVNQWSFDIQQKLPGDMVLTVGYVGSKSTHIDNTVEKNSPDPAFNTATSTVQSRRPYPFVIDNGVRRPLSRIRWLDSGANAWYQGLQGNLQKRFSHGLLFNLAYTFSKSMMEGYGRNEGDGFNSNTYQNPRDRLAEKGRIGWDARHNAVFNFVYEIPWFAAMSQPVPKVLFAGWQANGIVTLRSGFPFSIIQGGIINTSNTPVRPDRIGGGELSNPTVNQWYNPDDFRIVSCVNTAIPEACKYGDSGNGILEGPGFKTLDFSLFKNFALSERFKLQFRSEFFNLFNTPQFNRPNVTLNTGGGFLPVRGANGQLTYPTQANISRGPGAITSTVAANRNIQFGLRLTF